ncbi:hypothetical protein GH733_011232 [Mirounga leonina]|nr:hypothetical protein GH733_011232 [Mirounga leonina]
MALSSFYRENPPERAKNLSQTPPNWSHQLPWFFPQLERHGYPDLSPAQTIYGAAEVQQPPPQPPVKLIEVDDERKLHTFMRSVWPQKLLLMIWHKRQHIALKKQCTKKNKEEAAEYAKLLAKRMKEAKEKCQKQIAKRQRLSSLRAPTSKLYWAN